MMRSSARSFVRSFACLVLLAAAFASEQNDDMVSSDTQTRVEHSESPKEHMEDLLSDPLKYVDLFTYMKSQQIFQVENELTEALAHEAKKGGVLAWHYSMVNDVKRNEAYVRAIEKLVTPDSIVLDIGTGAGLLALVSARAGAKHVYTVEFEPVLAALAKEIINDNGYSDKITVLNKLSTELVIGVDMPEKADILVSEIVDSVLVGEHMIPSYLDALKRLVKEDAKVTPTHGELWMMPIESFDLRDKRHVHGNTVGGFDFTFMNMMAGTSKGTSARMHDLRYRSLAGQQVAWSWNFLDREGREWPAFRQLQMTVESDGILDAALIWFDMWLDDKIVITTNPNVGWAHESHWVQYLFSFNPIPVREGDVVSFLIAVHETSVQGDVLSVNGRFPMYLDTGDLWNAFPSNSSAKVLPQDAEAQRAAQKAAMDAAKHHHKAHPSPMGAAAGYPEEKRSSEQREALGSAAAMRDFPDDVLAAINDYAGRDEHAPKAEL